MSETGFWRAIVLVPTIYVFIVLKTVVLGSVVVVSDVSMTIVSGAAESGVWGQSPSCCTWSVEGYNNGDGDVDGCRVGGCRV